jgi:hypothetical protein
VEHKQTLFVFIDQSCDLEKLANTWKAFGDASTQRMELDKWKRAPHVSLANVFLSPKSDTRSFEGSDELKGVGHFLLPTHRATGDGSEEQKLNLGGPPEQRQGGNIDWRDFSERQQQLRLAWRGEREILRELDKSIKDARFEVSSPIDGKMTTVATRDLWPYICLRFMNDNSEGRTRICGYRHCVTPYFVSQRLDQKYCKHSCAVKDNHLRRAQASEGKSERGTP